MSNDKALDPATDPSIAFGPISGVGATVQYEPWEGSETTSQCFLVVYTSTPDDDGDVELFRVLLGIYEGDNRPNVGIWKSTPDGIATGKRMPL